MTIEELKAHIAEAPWFQNLGQYPPAAGIVTLTNAEDLPGGWWWCYKTAHIRKSANR